MASQISPSIVLIGCQNQTGPYLELDFKWTWRESNPCPNTTFLFQSNENWLWGVMESNHRDRSVEPASLTAKWTPQNAGLTGFEPAPHAVTGRHCKPFNHRPISIAGITGLEPAPPPWQGGTCNQFNYTPIKRLLSEIMNCTFAINLLMAVNIRIELIMFEICC